MDTRTGTDVRLSAPQALFRPLERKAVPDPDLGVVVTEARRKVSLSRGTDRRVRGLRRGGLFEEPCELRLAGISEPEHGLVPATRQECGPAVHLAPTATVRGH